MIVRGTAPHRIDARSGGGDFPGGHVTADYHAMVGLLEAYPTPAFLLDGNKRLIWRNALCDELASFDELFVQDDGLRLAPGNIIGELVEHYADELEEMAASIKLDGVAHDAHLVFFGLSRSGAPEAEARERMCLVLLSPRDAVVPAANYNEVDLTRVEMKLVNCLVAGMTVREASAEMRISYHTARKYLQNLYVKTGVGRQAELVAYVSQMTGALHPRRQRGDQGTEG